MAVLGGPANGQHHALPSLFASVENPESPKFESYRNRKFVARPKNVGLTFENRPARSVFDEYSTVCTGNHGPRQPRRILVFIDQRLSLLDG
jgi:hypothetical protein